MELKLPSMAMAYGHGSSSNDILFMVICTKDGVRIPMALWQPKVADAIGPSQLQVQVEKKISTILHTELCRRNKSVQSDVQSDTLNVWQYERLSLSSAHAIQYDSNSTDLNIVRELSRIEHELENILQRQTAVRTATHLLREQVDKPGEFVVSTMLAPAQHELDTKFHALDARRRLLTYYRTLLNRVPSEAVEGISPNNVLYAVPNALYKDPQLVYAPSASHAEAAVCVLSNCIVPRSAVLVHT